MSVRELVFCPETAVFLALISEPLIEWIARIC